MFQKPAARMGPAHVFGYTGAWVLVVVLFAVWCGLGVIMMGQHGLAPDLPRVNEAVWLPRANRENAMLVAVARDGKLFSGDNQVLPDQLEDCLRQQLSRGSERKVYIRRCTSALMLAHAIGTWRRH